MSRQLFPAALIDPGQRVNALLSEGDRSERRVRDVATMVTVAAHIAGVTRAGLWNFSHGLIKEIEPPLTSQLNSVFSAGAVYGMRVVDRLVDNVRPGIREEDLRAQGLAAVTRVAQCGEQDPHRLEVLGSNAFLGLGFDRAAGDQEAFNQGVMAGVEIVTKVNYTYVGEAA
jgi:hypothetical protein